MMRARPALTLATWLLPLLTCGCMVQVGSCNGSWSTSGGQSVSERDGHLVLDGMTLPYDRWVDVDLDADGVAQLDVQTATGGVELQGGEEKRCKLSVHVHSSVEGDGEVAIHDGKLEVRSQHDGKVFINDVKGSVPEEIGLVIGTGTGDVLVEHAAKGKALSIDTGTGDVTMRGSEPASLDVDVGSASVQLEQGGATSVRVDCGAGKVRIVDGQWGKIAVDGGATDLMAKGAKIDSVSLDSGTGDLRLEGCTVDSARLDSGTGDLVIAGGSCKKASIDSGTGDIEVRDGAQVESQVSH